MFRKSNFVLIGSFISVALAGCDAPQEQKDLFCWEERHPGQILSDDWRPVREKWELSASVYCTPVQRKSASYADGGQSASSGQGTGGTSGGSGGSSASAGGGGASASSGGAAASAGGGGASASSGGASASAGGGGAAASSG